MKRRAFLASGAAAVAAGAAGATARAQFAQELIIAVSVPLTGELQRQGEAIADGVRGAVEETNRFTGALDRVWGMRTFDDMGAIATALANVTFASTDPYVMATVGNLQTTTTVASLQQYAAVQMPLIVPAATGDAVTARGYRNVWRLPTKDSTEGQLFARMLVDDAKPKAPLAVLQDGDYGYDVAQGFVNMMKSRHVDAADAYVFPFEKPDFALAAKTIVAKKPDYILLAGKTRDMGALVPALRTAGYTGRFGASDGFYNVDTLKLAKALGDGFIVSTSMPPLERAPGIISQLTDLRARYGSVNPLQAFGYAAAQIVIAATRRTSPNRLSVLSALQNGGTYQTLVGNFTFTPTGDPLDPNVYFYNITDDKFKYQRPAHVSSFVI